MAAGAMRHLFRIERLTVRANDFGDGDAVWEEIATVWGEWLPQSATETVVSQQVYGQTTSTIRFRAEEKLATLNHNDRMIDVGRKVIMNIVGVVSSSITRR